MTGLNKANSAAAAARRPQALNMRIAGASYRAIGEELGVSHVTAYKDVRKELDKLAAKTSETAEQLRTIELVRLDAMLLALWTQVMKGNHGAIDRVLKIMERRARLLGLDAPTKSAMTDPDGNPIAIVRLGMSIEGL